MGAWRSTKTSSSTSVGAERPEPVPRDSLPRWRLHERYLALMDTWTITVTNQGGATYDVDANRPLLETLEEQGVDLPYGCRYGGCITCAAKVTRQSRPVRTSRLNNRQLNHGYAVLCVARPISNCTLEVGVESHDELYRNPFSIRLSRMSSSPISPPQQESPMAEADLRIPETIEHRYDYDQEYIPTYCDR